MKLTKLEEFVWRNATIYSFEFIGQMLNLPEKSIDKAYSRALGKINGQVKKSFAK